MEAERDPVPERSQIAEWSREALGHPRGTIRSTVRVDISSLHVVPAARDPENYIGGKKPEAN